MPAEIVYVDRFRVHEGRSEEFKHYADEMSAFVKENEPGVTLFNFYLDDDGATGTAVYVFADAGALDRHLDIAGSKFQEGYELLAGTDIDLLGEPSERAIQMGRAFNARVKGHVAGFTR